MAVNTFDSYVYKIGIDSSYRLGILNEICNSSSIGLFSIFGKNCQANIVDIGCGSGQFTNACSDMMENASILGVDLSEELLTQAKNNHQAKKNLTFEVSSIDEISENLQSYDIIYSRFLFSHLQDPISVLQKILKNKRKDAYFLFEDVFDIETVTEGSKHHALYKWTNTYYRHFGALNTKPNVAQSMFSFIKETNLQLVQANFIQPHLITEKQKSILRLGVQEVAETLVENGSITSSELPKLLYDLNLVEESNDIILFPKYLQVCVK